MAFFTVNTNEENIKDYNGSGGNYLNKSGIYEVILKSVIVNTSPGGSQSINLWLEYNGQEQAIFNAMRLTNNDGSPNLGQQLFNKLCIVSGATGNTEIPDPVSRMVPIGKDGAEEECMVLEIFDDTPVILRMQMEYNMYNGKIQSNKVIRNFFRLEDKATASEIVNNTTPGMQYFQEEPHAEKVTYKDGLTEEDIAEWLKSRKSAPKEETKTPKGGFGGKKFGAKK